MQKVRSLLYFIEEKYGKKTKEYIREKTFESWIYVLYQVSSKKLTKEDLDKKLLKYKIDFPNGNSESFIKFLKMTNSDKYSISFSAQGYFLEEDEAEYYVINNIGGIDEAGCYKYAVISSFPLNTMYPETEEGTHRLFKYNTEDGGYKEISWGTDEESLEIHKHADVFA